MSAVSGRIAFRVDASVSIGTGHVMRCLTLANALQKQGAECVFVCRPHDGHLIRQIEARGYQIEALSPPVQLTQAGDDLPHARWLGTDWTADAAETAGILRDRHIDWLVVDHYGLDFRWEEKLRACCRRIMVLDDLADRKHDCAMLVDQSLGRSDADYRGLIGAGTRLFLGTKYALLRAEFAEKRVPSLVRRQAASFRHVMISMGGIDRQNSTGRVLDLLQGCPLPAGLHISVVMGENSPSLGRVREMALLMARSTQVLVGVTNMADVMQDCDLSIGAAGGTSWERCCLGLPTIMLVLAENQLFNARSLERAGAVRVVTNAEGAVDKLTDLIHSGQLATFLRQTSLAAAKLVDGLGVRRIVEGMLS